MGIGIGGGGAIPPSAPDTQGVQPQGAPAPDSNLETKEGKQGNGNGEEQSSSQGSSSSSSSNGILQIGESAAGLSEGFFISALNSQMQAQADVNVSIQLGAQLTETSITNAQQAAQSVADKESYQMQMQAAQSFTSGASGIAGAGAQGLISQGYGGESTTELDQKISANKFQSNSSQSTIDHLTQPPTDPATGKPLINPATNKPMGAPLSTNPHESPAPPPPSYRDSQGNPSTDAQAYNNDPNRPPYENEDITVPDQGDDESNKQLQSDCLSLLNNGRIDPQAPKGQTPQYSKAEQDNIDQRTQVAIKNLSPQQRETVYQRATQNKATIDAKTETFEQQRTAIVNINAQRGTMVSTAAQSCAQMINGGFSVISAESKKQEGAEQGRLQQYQAILGQAQQIFNQANGNISSIAQNAHDLIQTQAAISNGTRSG